MKETSATSTQQRAAQLLFKTQRLVLKQGEGLPLGSQLFELCSIVKSKMKLGPQNCYPTSFASLGNQLSGDNNQLISLNFTATEVLENSFSPAQGRARSSGSELGEPGPASRSPQLCMPSSCPCAALQAITHSSQSYLNVWSQAFPQDDEMSLNQLGSDL